MGWWVRAATSKPGHIADTGGSESWRKISASGTELGSLSICPSLSRRRTESFGVIDHRPEDAEYGVLVVDPTFYENPGLSEYHQPPTSIRHNYITPDPAPMLLTSDLLRVTMQCTLRPQF